MKILLISPEGGSWTKPGNLNATINQLGLAYESLGHDVRVISPVFPSRMDRSHEYTEVFRNEDELHHRPYRVLRDAKSIFYFVDYPDYFDRKGLYDEEGDPYSDNHQRFSLLGLAALEYCRESRWKPDLIHAHEWAGGLACAYARSYLGEDFLAARIIFTVHNLRYDFYTFESEIELLGLDRRDFSINGYEFWGKISLLKLGMFYSDQVVFTSKGYWERMQRSDSLQGGLHGYLMGNSAKIDGIQNGLNYQFWDAGISGESFDRFFQMKTSRRNELQQQFGLEKRECFLVYCHADEESGRLTKTLSTIMSNLLHMDLQVIITLAESHSEYSYFRMISDQHPGQVVLNQDTDRETLRHILGGSDALFSAGMEEPSASLLLKALAMGCVPVTSEKNGSEDWIVPYTIPMDEGVCAFTSESEEPDRMLRSLRQALEIYTDHKSEWQEIVENAINTRVSWEDTAKGYIAYLRSESD